MSLGDENKIHPFSILSSYLCGHVMSIYFFIYISINSKGLQPVFKSHPYHTKATYDSASSSLLVEVDRDACSRMENCTIQSLSK